MANSKGYQAKLPAKQLAILAVARVAEPLALTSVFPYLPEMIESFGVDKDNVAFWAGITGAVFSLAQSMTAVPWGRASDKFGRKPVILLGLVSTMTCFIFWGMSTSLTMAITVRAIMGGTNGNVGIIRTMVAEMVPERELQPKAFSIMPMVWAVGSVFGPAFGGLLARPADQYPGLFGHSAFLKKFPFALPNLVAFCVFFVSVATGLLFLKESLETKRHTRDWGLVLGEKLTHPFRKPKVTAREQRSGSFVDDEAAAPLLSHMSAAHRPKPSQAPPSMREVFTRQVVINMVSYTFLALHSVAFDQILPVFLHHPPQIPNEHNTRLPFYFSGGFGLDTDKIGTILAIYGVVCGLIQFFIFPPLCRAVGVLRLFRIVTWIYPFVYLLVPYTALVQTQHLRYTALVFLLLLKGCVVIIGFPCTTILLTNSAPSLRILGTLNGFATAFSGLGRAFGPALTGTVFSIGVKRGYMIAPWWLLGCISLVGAFPALFIIEQEGPKRDAEDDDDMMSDETAVATPDSDDDDYGASRAIIAGDGGDLVGVSEDRIFPEPEDLSSGDEDEVVPPLPGVKDLDSPKKAAHSRKPSLKLRRMSAAGQDLEHDPNDPAWRSKQCEADK